jgi:hypothetical protein
VQPTSLSVFFNTTPLDTASPMWSRASLWTITAQVLPHRSGCDHPVAQHR